jgi:hypothetical protein
MGNNSCLRRERLLFVACKESEQRKAAQRVALRLSCGLDLDALLCGSQQIRDLAIAKVRRLLRREQIKGARGHHGYDINRQIALRQALNLLSAPA